VYTVEYYSNDNGAWEESSRPYSDYALAVETMRQQAGMCPDIPHRIVETIRTTVALTAHGEELVKLDCLLEED